jgi:hypothetical protein
VALIASAVARRVDFVAARQYDTAGSSRPEVRLALKLFLVIAEEPGPALLTRQSGLWDVPWPHSA